MSIFRKIFSAPRALYNFLCKESAHYRICFGKLTNLKEQLYKGIPLHRESSISQNEELLIASLIYDAIKKIKLEVNKSETNLVLKKIDNEKSFNISSFIKNERKNSEKIKIKALSDNVEIFFTSCNRTSIFLTISFFVFFISLCASIFEIVQRSINTYGDLSKITSSFFLLILFCIVIISFILSSIFYHAFHNQDKILKNFYALKNGKTGCDLENEVFSVFNSPSVALAFFIIFSISASIVIFYLQQKFHNGSSFSTLNIIIVTVASVLALASLISFFYTMYDSNVRYIEQDLFLHDSKITKEMFQLLNDNNKETEQLNQNINDDFKFIDDNIDKSTKIKHVFVSDDINTMLFSKNTISSKIPFSMSSKPDENKQIIEKSERLITYSMEHKNTESKGDFNKIKFFKHEISYDENNSISEIKVANNFVENLTVEKINKSTNDNKDNAVVIYEDDTGRLNFLHI